MKVKSQLIDAQIEHRGSNPTKKGEVVVQTADSNQVKYHDGSSVRTVANTDQSQTFTNKTHTSPVLNTGVSGTAVLDEDDLISDSDTQLATQQSIKAYSDTTKVAKAGSTMTGELDLNLPLKMAEQGSTPSTPASGHKLIYPKSDGKVYTLDDAGNEIQVGAGAGGGSKNYIDSDSSNLEINIGSWETDDGAGSAATTITLSHNTTTPLSGDGDLSFAKSAADGDGEFAKLTTLGIDRSDRGKILFFSCNVDATDASYASNLEFEFYDNTNNAVLYAGSSEERSILGIQTKQNLAVHLEDTTAEIEVRVKINDTDATAYTVYFDDIKLGPAASVQTVYRKSATIDLTGSGDFTGGEIQVERVGNQVVVSVNSALTYASNSDAQSAIGLLPSWARPSSIKTNTYVSSIGGTQRIGIFADGKISIYSLNTSFAATNTTTSTTFTSISYTVPEIAGPTMTDNELSLQTIEVTGAGNGGTAITADTTNIDFTEVTDEQGTWNGSQFTAPVTMKYRIQGVVRFSGSVSASLYSYIDGVEDKFLDNRTAATHTFSWEGILQAGEVWSLRSDAGGTLSNNTTLHWISISSLPKFTFIGAVQERNYAVIDLTGSGDFTGGELTVSKSGDTVTVTITDALTYSSASTVASASGALPEWARPSRIVTSLIGFDGNRVYQADVTTAGVIDILARDWAGSTSANVTTLYGSFSYVIKR